MLFRKEVVEIQFTGFKMKCQRALSSYFPLGAIPGSDFCVMVFAIHLRNSPEESDTSFRGGGSGNWHEGTFGQPNSEA